MKPQGVSMIESLAVMGKVNPFFERAGMVRFDPPADADVERMKQALEMIGVDEPMWIDPDLVYERIECLADSERAFIESEIDRFLQRYGKRRFMEQGVERIEYVLGKLGDRPSYFVWLNPEIPVKGLAIKS